jgi:hypothetical protein
MALIHRPLVLYNLRILPIEGDHERQDRTPRIADAASDMLVPHEDETRFAWIAPPKRLRHNLRGLVADR